MIMHDIAPRELLVALKSIYLLEFVPTPILSLVELGELLEAKQAKLGPWVEELWDEYLDYDSILAHDGEGNVYRFIWTITLLVMREHSNRHVRRSMPRLLRREYLRETIEWPDGRITERTYNNTLSEKWKWKVNGKWRFTESNWRKQVRQAGVEELNINLTKQFLHAPWLRRFGPTLRYFKDPKTGTEEIPIDRKDDDHKRPHVITYNRLIHVFLKLHEVYWRAEYREPKFDRHGNLKKTMVHTWEAAGGLYRPPARHHAKRVERVQELNV